MNCSNTAIQTYKSCRRMYELRYIYGVTPVQKAEALEVGTSYHNKIEHLLRGEPFEHDDPKTTAMAKAFQKYILPKLNPVAVEEWFNFHTEMGDNIVGRIDALNKDGALIEHKTTSGEINEEYWYMRSMDEQLMTYMLAYDTNKAYYTVCRKPTIRQKQKETDEEFAARCEAWYDEDTDSKIAMAVIEIPWEQLREFREMLAMTVDEMDGCNLFYRNTSYCTHWGRMCEYAPICQHYDPDETYIGFERRE